YPESTLGASHEKEKEGNIIYYLKLAPTTLEKYNYIVIIYRVADNTFKGLTTITKVLTIKLPNRRELDLRIE
ncbi:hypothetical protein N7475_004561, partial [Penicillium sp. IBT 31633x]